MGIVPKNYPKHEIREFKHSMEHPKLENSDMLAPLGKINLGEKFYLKKKNGNSTELVMFYLSAQKQFVSIDFTFAPNLKANKEINPDGSERQVTTVEHGREIWKNISSMGFSRGEP